MGYNATVSNMPTIGVMQVQSYEIPAKAKSEKEKLISERILF
jgi:hypothetical protein